MKVRYGVFSLIGLLVCVALIVAFTDGPKFYLDQQVLIKTINYNKQQNIEIEFQVPTDKRWYADGVNIQPYQSGYLIRFVKCATDSRCDSQIKAVEDRGSYRVQFPQDRQLWIREQRGVLRLSPRLVPAASPQAPKSAESAEYL